MRTTIEEPLSSSDARAAILSRHEELRVLVLETMLFAEHATQAERNVEPLRTHARVLYEAFREHMDFEDEILATALGDVVGLGSVLRAQLEQGHEKQRATLVSALSALEPEGPGDELVESVRSFVDAILLDLRSEERCLLTADLDALAADSHGG
jgi:hypothetical protein